MRLLLVFVFVILLVGCVNEYPPSEYIVIPVNQTVTPEVIRYSDSNGDYTIYYGTTPTPNVSNTPVIVEPTHEATAIPTVAQTPIPKPSPTSDRCFGTVTADRLNIRETPPSGTVIGTALKGDVLTLEQQTAINGVTWYHIFDGWVSGAWVVTSGNCTDLVTVNPF